MAEFSLLQPSIMRLLSEGKEPIDKEDWFLEAIEAAAKSIGARRNAKIVVQIDAVLAAQRDWRNDMKSLIGENRIPGAEIPCNKKHAAFLCYWLRRRQIVRDISGNNISDEHLRHYPNEFIAARIGLILLFYTEFFQPGVDDAKMMTELEERFPAAFFQDFVVMLRYKNVSPHGIYLAFKALVTPVAIGKQLRLVDDSKPM